MVDGGDERRLGARQGRPVQAPEPRVQLHLRPMLDVSEPPSADPQTAHWELTR